ncbi:nonribosomal peptide synthetase MxaA [Hyphomicrobium sp.]|uniref:nonribosomal peptide synthetase MxaA n=1 Tax=Hyphomicrobium sp. TaxID=82 RepID=UPI0025BDBA33|nr:nonribosomal peptide synthetase MxaA [Hyphomicrobium sp.]MCC7250901.1 nonribosomal peptide synthetase MxaA [Hyphomicrobium sp.]
MRASLAFLLALAALAPSAAAEVRSVHTIEPRPFGYFLGDMLERTVEIETGPDDEIVQASLPRTGASNYWLELRAIAQSSARQGDGRLHTLKLTYQAFYAPIDPRKQTIPSTEITIRGPNGSETARIPPFTFIMSPLREIFPEKSGETAETFLRPDVAPQPRRSGGLRTGALIAAGLSALFLVLLARDLAWWPFHRRPARPFSRAAREIGHALAKGGADGYRAALLALHRAFDTAAGHRLLAADLDGFLTAHPEHGDTRSLVERFFSASRAVFFGDAQREGETRLPPSELKELAATLARQERAAR